MSISPPYNEKELLLATASGDEKAFSELFHHYRNKIYTVAFNLTASVENAEEIVQDVFLKVWLKQDKLTTVKDFDSWLFVITRNTVYDFLSSKAAQKLKRTTATNEFIGISNVGADARLNEKEFKRILAEGVEKLIPIQKQIYQLSKEEELRYDEIGQRLNMPPETVRKYLQFAMRNLRAYLLSRMDLGVLLLFLWKL